MKKNKIKYPRKSKSSHKILEDECDRIWAELIKAMAGYKSEISGKLGKQIGGEHILNAHHLRHKPNYRLRYDLEGGVCCTNGEHQFGFHNPKLKDKYEDLIVRNPYRFARNRRPGLLEYLDSLKWQSGVTRLQDVYVYLSNELKRFDARKI